MLGFFNIKNISVEIGRHFPNKLSTSPWEQTVPLLVEISIYTYKAKFVQKRIKNQPITETNAFSHASYSITLYLVILLQ